MDHVSRYLSHEAFGDYVLLPVDPQLDLGAQIVHVVRVGAEEGDQFGKGWTWG